MKVFGTEINDLAPAAQKALTRIQDVSESLGALIRVAPTSTRGKYVILAERSGDDFELGYIDASSGNQVIAVATSFDIGNDGRVSTHLEEMPPQRAELTFFDSDEYNGTNASAEKEADDAGELEQFMPIVFTALSFAAGFAKHMKDA